MQQRVLPSPAPTTITLFFGLPTSKFFAIPVMDNLNIIFDRMLGLHAASGETKKLTNIIQYLVNIQPPLWLFCLETAMHPHGHPQLSAVGPDKSC